MRDIVKLTIEKNQLIKSLTLVSKGMSSRTTLPILSSIYLEAYKGTLTFRTSDLEISIQHTTDALIEKEGATVVPGKLFSDIVKSLPDAAVILEQDKDNLTIKSLDTKFVVHTLNPSDFPLFPEVDVLSAVTVPSKTISDMVKKVAKAVSRDESRAVLTGILLKIEQDTIQMVATDSYRVAISKSGLEDTTEASFDLIVPGSVLDEIGRLVVGEEKVIISDSQNQIIFDFGKTTFITRKIEGTYPNYEAIIPTEKSISATVETSSLLTAVKRIAITAQSHSPVRFLLDPPTQTIEISSSTQDVASSIERVGAQIDGEELAIGFNHQYILDGLSVIDTEEVLFEAQTSQKPGILKTIGESYFFYLTMPVRIDK